MEHLSAHAQVRDDDAGEGAGEVRRAPGGESAREVRVVAAVVVAHVHAAVEHDALPADGRHHAALPHLLPRPCTRSVSAGLIEPCLWRRNWRRGAAVYLGRGIRLPSLAARRGRRRGGGQGGASTPPAEEGDVEVRRLRGRWPVGRRRGMAVGLGRRRPRPRRSRGRGMGRRLRNYRPIR